MRWGRKCVIRFAVEKENTNTHYKTISIEIDNTVNFLQITSCISIESYLTIILQEPINVCSHRFLMPS